MPILVITEKLYACIENCSPHSACLSPCKAVRFMNLVKAAIADGMPLGEALRVVYAIGMGGTYPMADAILDAEFLDILDSVGLYGSATLENAFYDSLSTGR